MFHSELEYLKHILDEINYLERNSTDLNFKNFIKDDTKTRAFIRSLEIIGGASKKISNEFRKKYKEVEWKSISGMRDKLIHDYFGVDYELVLDVVKNNIPLLKKQVKEILKKEER